MGKQKEQFHRQGYINPLPTTDIIIEYNDGKKDGIVLIKRKNDPIGLAIPGGFAEFGLSYEENAVKEAKEETGLDVMIEEPERPLCVHSDLNRDPRGHMVSNAFIARGYGKLNAGDDADKAFLYTIPEVKEIIFHDPPVFDHSRILVKYLRHRGYMMEFEKERPRRAGIIGRFKPLHKGGAALLETLCEKADHVVIGLGSCNQYDARNPFTADESRDMIDSFLRPRFSNYEFVYVPDYGHIPEFSDGKRWKEEVKELFGPLDVFVSGNPYTAELLKDDYRIAHPIEVMEGKEEKGMRASEVRRSMLMGEDYPQYLPDAVMKYLDGSGLVARFCREFGDKGLYIKGGPTSAESIEREKERISGGG